MKTMSMQKKAENEMMRHTFRRSHSQAECATLSDNRPSTLVQRKQAEAMQHLTMSVDTLQRTPIEDEELLQGKFQSFQLQPEDEELLQGKFKSFQLQEDEEELQGKFEPALRPENRTGLPDNLKSGIENLSGMDMSDVHVHYSSALPAQLNALAYAQGTEIHLGSGQQHHLPHEAWHVAQQKQDRVQPTVQIEGYAVNNDGTLEHEADIMGERASRY